MLLSIFQMTEKTPISDYIGIDWVKWVLSLLSFSSELQT